jgi:hypothetical protein
MIDIFPGLVTDLPQFFLGVLGPDAVHFRDNFTGDDKKSTHLCVYETGWGMWISKEDERAWINNALVFLRERETLPERDFVYGYVTHVLTDVYNNMRIWRAFLEAHPGFWENQGRDNISHRESALIDRRLYQTYAKRTQLWEYLTCSRCFDFAGLVSEAEMTRVRENILYKQYSDITDEAIDTSANTLRTYEEALEYIDSGAEFAGNILIETRRY